MSVNNGGVCLLELPQRTKLWRIFFWSSTCMSLCGGDHLRCPRSSHHTKTTHLMPLFLPTTFKYRFRGLCTSWVLNPLINNWACCACEDPSETWVKHREVSFTRNYRDLDIPIQSENQAWKENPVWLATITGPLHSMESVPCHEISPVSR